MKEPKIFREQAEAVACFSFMGVAKPRFLCHSGLPPSPAFFFFLQKKKKKQKEEWQNISITRKFNRKICVVWTLPLLSPG